MNPYDPPDASADDLSDADRNFAKAVADDDIVLLLASCRAGADVNRRDPRTGRTALFTMIDKHSTPDYGDRRGSVMAMFFALLQNGADPNVAGHDGVTVLHHALAQEEALFVSVIALRDDVDMNTPDPVSGDTPLHKAAAIYLAATEDLQKAIVDVMIPRGGNPTIPNKAGVTALDIARAATGDNAAALLQKLEAAPAVRQDRLREKAKGFVLKPRGRGL